MYRSLYRNARTALNGDTSKCFVVSMGISTRGGSGRTFLQDHHQTRPRIHQFMSL
jgi:hypothetical protein